MICFADQVPSPTLTPIERIAILVKDDPGLSQAAEIAKRDIEWLMRFGKEELGLDCTSQEVEAAIQFAYWQLASTIIHSTGGIDDAIRTEVQNIVDQRLVA